MPHLKWTCLKTMQFSIVLYIVFLYWVAETKNVCFKSPCLAVTDNTFCCYVTNCNNVLLLCTLCCLCADPNINFKAIFVLVTVWASMSSMSSVSFVYHTGSRDAFTAHRHPNASFKKNTHRQPCYENLTRSERMVDRAGDPFLPREQRPAQAHIVRGVSDAELG